MDPQFAMLESSYRPPTELIPDYLVVRLDLASKQLSGYSRGLVEVVSRQTFPHIRTVGFTHRSIAEFLSEDERGEEMESLLGEFNAVDAASQLALAEASACPRLAFQERPWHSDAVFPILTAWRARYRLGSSYYVFLEAMAAAVLRARSKHCEDWFPKPHECRSQDATSTHFQTTIQVGIGCSSILASCRKAGPLEAVGATPPLLPIYEAAELGNWGYVKWKLLKQPSNVCPQAGLEILLYSMLGTPYWGSKAEEVEEVCKVMDILIAKGLTPQTRTNISPVIYQFRSEFHMEDSEVDIEMTIWQYLLILCYFNTIDRRLSRMPRMGRALSKSF